MILEAILILEPVPGLQLVASLHPIMVSELIAVLGLHPILRLLASSCLLLHLHRVLHARRVLARHARVPGGRAAAAAGSRSGPGAAATAT
ncbi:hypothetical protein [Salinisphaera hydrothermalis]|uniref:hypothetical protein n=1 Tax=Salinisphaera hydrothermalis TaxID=563188 RepID=UPI0033417148